MSLQPSCFVIHRVPQSNGLFELRIEEYGTEPVDPEQLLAHSDILPEPGDFYEYWLEAKIGLINQLEALAVQHRAAGNAEAAEYYSAQAVTWKTMKLNNDPRRGHPTIFTRRASHERREAIVLDGFEIEHEPGEVAEYRLYTHEVTYIGDRAIFVPIVSRIDDDGFHKPEGDEATRVLAYMAAKGGYKAYRAPVED